MSQVESNNSYLDHIRFGDAREMCEIQDGSAQLVYLSPPYVGHHTMTEREDEKRLNEELMNEAARVTDLKFGFVVTYNTDFYLKGGIYPRHDIVREAAKTAGLELYATKYHISSFNRDQFRMTLHHIQVFIHSGEIISARKRNKRLAEYEPDAWYFNKKQHVGDFRDAIPPEAAVIPIANFTEKGELVVSQCAGTGTIVIAALKMGRRSIGYEIEKSREKLMEIRQRDFEKYFSSQNILDMIARE